MSVANASDLFDIHPIKRTELVGDAKSTIAVFFEALTRAPGDPLGGDQDSESAPADWWQHYGFLSRPPVGAEGIFMRLGANVVTIASRALAAAGIFGQMSVGDVAIYSVGKNVLRLNADGSVSLMRLTKSGKHVIAIMTKDDKVQVLIPPATVFEMTPQGITLKGDTITIAGSKSVQIIGPQLNCAVGVNKLHIGASLPLVPTSAAPNVFV